MQQSSVEVGLIFGRKALIVEAVLEIESVGVYKILKVRKKDLVLKSNSYNWRLWSRKYLEIFKKMLINHKLNSKIGALIKKNYN